ncbi:MAG: MFS transporter [Cyanobacteria bacterium PR.023]|jgi:ACS family hexuronate transporter-like MFS transporter|nr:MFS transporter [Cyanobacteria bacterium PR.023]MDQ5935145.1 transporter, family, hexuronate transporter [Cyanobacteriota bacterium erpe_2018_sw_21hr_WHONDRS-SW48-000092_B_bin.40]
MRASENAVPPQAIETQTKASNYRWVIIGFGFLITLINYLDRSAMAYAIGPIKAEFGFNNEQFGAIAAAFAVGYALMTLGGGILVDKWGARSVWSGAAVLWSACTALMGICSSYPIFFTVRVMLGITEGPHFPALTRVVADWLPSTERARSTAMGLCAVPMAGVIGAPLITSLIASFGWKAMFAILGSAGIVWAVIWWFIYRDYPEHSKFVNDAELKIIREGQPLNRERKMAEMKAHDISLGKTTWKFLFTNPSLIANNFAFFGFGYLLFFSVTWLPGYMEQTYHLHLKHVGELLVAPWLTAAVMLFSAGFLSDYLWKKTGSMRVARSHMMWICQLLSGLCFIPLMFNPSLETALVMYSLGLGFGLMPNAAFYAINCDLAKDKAATSLGLMDCYLGFAGVLAPYLTGKLSYITHNFNSAFFILIFFTLTGSMAVLFFQHPDKDMKRFA